MSATAEAPKPAELAEDVGIVGAGIAGLAHALSAARRGHRVTVFERGPTAAGASIRNFGMVWPIGQPAGDRHAIALESRGIWLELGREAGLWVNPCGSIHLAHRDDEWAVLEEFARAAPDLGYECEIWTRDKVLKQTDAANPEFLIGGLFSPTELAVSPRAAIRMLPDWLTRRFGVRFEFATAIVDIDHGWLKSADGRSWHFHRTLVCGGADFETLLPEVFRTSGLKRCKLQMLATARQPDGWQLGPHLASGLTLRHYANFAVAPSLSAVRSRIAAETPELDRFGIHVMASQNDAGEVILGDSHEYDEAISPFDKAEIDALIFRELRRVIRLPDWTIAERWHGVYAKHEKRPVFEAEPMPGVHVRTGLGGAGMTMALGLAERCWESWS
jgi:FAD dependent oxidoreductase TIGR03364